MKDIKKIIFNKEASNKSDCFQNKLSEIKAKHKEFLKEKEIDFDSSIVFSYDDNHMKYSFINKVSDLIEKEVEEAFNECMKSTNSKSE